MPVENIAVGGFSPLSTCDWPGELVATVFCQGCPLACRYCHNVDLIPAGPGAGPDWWQVLSILERRRGLLDGVVFSGGEPTLQNALPEAIVAVRALGFRVGLHTAGPYPERFARLLPDIDWVGFDVKAPFADYERITGVSGSGARARESLVALAGSGVAFEVRTTVHPLLLDDADLARLDDDLALLGLGPTRRQLFRSQGCPRCGVADCLKVDQGRLCCLTVHCGRNNFLYRFKKAPGRLPIIGGGGRLLHVDPMTTSSNPCPRQRPFGAIG